MKKKTFLGVPVQWLGLSAFTAEGPGSIPGWGNKISKAMQCEQIKKRREREDISCSTYFPDTNVYATCIYQKRKKVIIYHKRYHVGDGRNRNWVPDG